MLSADFVRGCLEAKFSPLVNDDRTDEEIFRHLRQLKIGGETVAVATDDDFTPRVLFVVEKASIAELGFLCVTKLQG